MLIHQTGQGNSSDSGSGGTISPNRYLIGQWNTTNIPANFNSVIARATGQKSTVQVPRACILKRVVFTMSLLNLIDAAKGSALLVKVVRTSAAGVADAAVTVATIAVGESNVVRDSLVQIALAAGDAVQVQLTTDASWTGTTCDPGVSLEVEEV